MALIILFAADKQAGIGIWEPDGRRHGNNRLETKYLTFQAISTYVMHAHALCKSNNMERRGEMRANDNRKMNGRVSGS